MLVADQLGISLDGEALRLLALGRTPYLTDVRNA
jgi:hypothetical protein